MLPLKPLLPSSTPSPWQDSWSNYGDTSNRRRWMETNNRRGFYQKTGEILADIVGNNLSTVDTETEIELNFAV